jgi:hypothetical protein
VQQPRRPPSTKIKSISPYILIITKLIHFYKCNYILNIVLYQTLLSYLLGVPGLRLKIKIVRELKNWCIFWNLEAFVGESICAFKRNSPVIIIPCNPFSMFPT